MDVNVNDIIIIDVITDAYGEVATEIRVVTGKLSSKNRITTTK